MQWKEPPAEVKEVAQLAADKLLEAFSSRIGDREVAGPILYARVDVLETADGPKVGEVEMVEPELFFLMRDPHSPKAFQPALDLFCDAVIRFMK